MVTHCVDCGALVGYVGEDRCTICLGVFLARTRGLTFHDEDKARASAARFKALGYVPHVTYLSAGAWLVQCD